MRIPILLVGIHHSYQFEASTQPSDIERQQRSRFHARISQLIREFEPTNRGRNTGWNGILVLPSLLRDAAWPWVLMMALAEDGRGFEDRTRIPRCTLGI